MELPGKEVQSKTVTLKLIFLAIIQLLLHYKYLGRYFSNMLFLLISSHFLKQNIFKCLEHHYFLCESTDIGNSAWFLLLKARSYFPMTRSVEDSAYTQSIQQSADWGCSFVTRVKWKLTQIHTKNA